MATNSSDTQDPCATPLIANPSGAPPNFVHRALFEPITIGTITTFIVIAIIFVGLRIIGTLRKERKLFVDDYLCLFTLPLVLVFGIDTMLVGRGYTHAWNMNSCQVDKIQNNRLLAAGLLLYLPTILAVKGVICALYLRIFESIRWLRYVTWTVLIYYGLICSFGFCLYLAHFILVKFNDSENGPIDLRPYMMTQVSSTVLVDLFLLALPIQPIMKMQTLSFRKRVSLLAVFLAGAGATMCTLIMLIYNKEYYYPSKNLYMILEDWTWTVNITNLLSVVEVYMTLILGCVPGVVSAWRNVIRNSWLMTSIFGFSREESSQEMDKEQKLGQEHNEDTLKVRNNDRTLRLETI